MDELGWSVTDGVGTIVLNRPEKRNAFTLAMIEEWLARTIADHPPVTVRMIKRATYQSANTDLRTALDLISSHFAVVAATEDAAEALTAMQERRPAHYKGR